MSEEFDYRAEYEKLLRWCKEQKNLVVKEEKRVIDDEKNPMINFVVSYKNKKLFDACYHSRYSYGLEIMGLLTKETFEEDTIEGHLTAREIIERIETVIDEIDEYGRARSFVLFDEAASKNNQSLEALANEARPLSNYILKKEDL